MTTALAEVLAQELSALTKETLARAAHAKFVRVSEQGRIVTRLLLSTEARSAAAADYARFREWTRVVGSVLSRRGALPAAKQVERLASDLEQLVRFRRQDVAETRETRWREGYFRELTDITTGLISLVREHAPLFDLVRGRPSLEYDAFHLHAGHDARFEELHQKVPAKSGDRAAYGRELFRALFTAETEAAYRSAKETARQRGCGLRLQLHVSDAPPLPWELLHDDSDFLALSRDTPVVRGVPGPESLVLAAAAPLRILVTVSAPPPPLEWLDGRAEVDALRSALGPLITLGAVELDVAPDGTLLTLRRMLRTASDRGEPFSVWHFIGHGTFDPAADRSALAMEAPGAKVHSVGGAELATLVRDHPELRIAFLNSCNAARGDPTARTAAVARALVEAGVPAVIAMQAPIEDVTAAHFSSEFYGAFADGLGVEEAVTEGRRGIFFSPRGEEWFLPVLFLNDRRGGGMASHGSGRAQR